MTAALIERLEKAEAGSHELDAAIAKAFGAPAVLTFGHELLGNEYTAPNHAPMVTRSIDAALALAERALPGWGWCMRTDDTGQCFANVFPGSPNVDRIYFDVYAASHPLALCVAILKAKVAQQ